MGRNLLYVNQGRAISNELAAQARALFQADADLSSYYNHTLANGKWDHMMDQTHIGYTGWRDPPTNVMPKVDEIDVPVPAALAIAVEGSVGAWPGRSEAPALPVFDAFNRQRRYIDVFNRGRTSYSFTASSAAPWISLSATHGTINKEQRVWVNVDWTKAPRGQSAGSVKIKGAGAEAMVKVEAVNPETPARASLSGFVEANGYVSMEAEHYTQKTDAGPVHWEKIADYGRTLSSMTVFPVTAESASPPQNSPCLAYRDVFVPLGDS